MAMSSSSVEKEARRAVSLLDHSKIMFPPGRETAIGFISRRTELGPGKFGKYRRQGEAPPRSLYLWLGEARFGECRSRAAPLSGFLRVCGICVVENCGWRYLFCRCDNHACTGQVFRLRDSTWESNHICGPRIR